MEKVKITQKMGTRREKIWHFEITLRREIEIREIL